MLDAAHETPRAGKNPGPTVGRSRSLVLVRLRIGEGTAREADAEVVSTAVVDAPTRGGLEGVNNVDPAMGAESVELAKRRFCTRRVNAWSIDGLAVDEIDGRGSSSSAFAPAAR